MVAINRHIYQYGVSIQNYIIIFKENMMWKDLAEDVNKEGLQNLNSIKKYILES